MAWWELFHCILKDPPWKVKKRFRSLSPRNRTIFPSHLWDQGVVNKDGHLHQWSLPRVSETFRSLDGERSRECPIVVTANDSVNPSRMYVIVRYLQPIFFPPKKLQFEAYAFLIKDVQKFLWVISSQESSFYTCLWKNVLIPDMPGARLRVGPWCI